MHGAARMTVREISRRPVGRIELRELPAQGVRLPGHGRDEGVHGGGVRDVAEELAAARAGDVAPGQGVCHIAGRGAPALPGGAHGGAVPPGQQRQSPVGQDQATLGGGTAGRQTNAFKAGQELRHPRLRDPPAARAGRPG